MECDTDSRQEVDDTAAPVRSNSMQKLVIRTLPKGCNPMPVVDRPPSRGGSVVPTFEDDNPFDDLTEEKLRQLSGKQDLNRVTHLQLTVDTHKQSVEALGELLPSLTQLRLHQSVLHSFRDLGTSLHGLQILWLIRSGVKDLDGIGALTGLRELYLQFNEIADVSPLSMHDELHIVDLQGNAVEDIVQIEQLGMCVQLASLNLADNPVANIPQYRPIVCSYIPHLQSLDNAPVAATDRIEVTPAMIDQALSYTHPKATDLKRCDSVKTTDARVLAESASTSSFEHLLDTAARDKDHHSSELTHGTDVVFAGNVTSALRRRSNEHFHVDFDDASNIIRPATPVAAFPPRPSTPLHRESITDTLDRASELDLSCRLSSKSRDSILNELKAWKMESTVGATTTPTATYVSAKPKADSARPSTTSRLSVKEAFVEVQHPRKDLRKRSSAKHQVEILVLDEMPEEQSPTQRQWSLDLECLSPRIGVVPKPASRQYLPQEADGDDSSSDSDADDRPKKPKTGLFNVGDSLNAIEEWTERITKSEKEEGGPLVVAPMLERCRTPKHQSSKTTSHRKQPSKTGDLPPSPKRQSSSRGGPDLAMCSGAAEPDLLLLTPPIVHTKGPEMPAKPAKAVTEISNHVESTYNALADDDLVLVLQGKDKRYLGHLKTKESFRSFFQGIAAPHLEKLLRRAYGDTDKVQRRLQLMEGRMAVA